MGINLSKSTMSQTPNSIAVYQGASKDVNLAIIKDMKDVDDNPIDVPFDLTGCELIFSVRTDSDSPKIVLSKSSTDISQILIGQDTLLGKATIFIGYLDTENLDPGIYIFDVWVREPSGKRYPVVEPSEFKVLNPITRFRG